MYNISFNKKAEKELAKLHTSMIRKILQAIAALADEPRPQGCKKLKGSELWRIREGDYRIVYDIDDVQKGITIQRIRHRKDAYTI